MTKLYIIIPAHNEDKRIGPTLKDYLTFYNSNLMELIVVINNTSDNTEAIVKEYEQTNSNLSHIVTPAGGKGYAIMLGFKEALVRSQDDDDLICFVDADNATDPENLGKVIAELELGVLDPARAAIASRYLSESVLEPSQSFKRKAASRLFNFFVTFFLPLKYKDTQCGCKVIHSKELKQIYPLITSMRWSWDIDFLLQLQRNNISCIECPITWRDKEYSTINFLKAGPKMAMGVLRLRIMYSPFKFLVKIYNKLPTWCKPKIE